MDKWTWTQSKDWSSCFVKKSSQMIIHIKHDHGLQIMKKCMWTWSNSTYFLTLRSKFFCITSVALITETLTAVLLHKLLCVTSVTNKTSLVVHCSNKKDNRISFVKNWRCTLHKTFTEVYPGEEGAPEWHVTTSTCCIRLRQCTDGRLAVFTEHLYTHSIPAVHTAHGSGGTMLVDINGWSRWFNKTIFHSGS